MEWLLPFIIWIGQSLNRITIIIIIITPTTKPKREFLNIIQCNSNQSESSLEYLFIGEEVDSEDNCLIVVARLNYLPRLRIVWRRSNREKKKIYERCAYAMKRTGTDSNTIHSNRSIGFLFVRDHLSKSSVVYSVQVHTVYTFFFFISLANAQRISRSNCL